MNYPQHPDSFAPAGFFALRTPLLPFDELLEWSRGLQARTLEQDAARLEEALAADRAHLRARLSEIVTRPEVREALFVASPDLDSRIDVWLRQPESEAGQKMERALVRYLVRMAGRPTPFGLCAGCSVGTIAAQTRFALLRRDRYRRHSRLDMDYVLSLTEGLTRQPGLRRNLSFRPNTSLYHAHGRVHYEEIRRNDKGWSHHRVALECSDYLTATLAKASAKASRDELAAALVEADPEASLSEAEEYIDELIDSQVLVSELTPAMTGPEPILPLVNQLRERGAADAADRLEEARLGLEAMDTAPLGVEPSAYRAIAGRLEELPAKLELPRLFQVDMVKPMAEATLGPTVVEEIRRGVQLLHRLSRRPSRSSLAHFREAFSARYERREVPLVEALDEDLGVGFAQLDGQGLDASALLEGIAFPQPREEMGSWGRRETFLLRKLSEALMRGAREIVLSPQDVDDMASPDPPPLPDSFSVMATLAARSESALTRGDFRVLLECASGPSGARLFGRFCHSDPELCELVKLYVRAEEALSPEALIAEIVHQAEGRLGNITIRPTLREYEIPYLGASGVPAERQIPITDLRVSVVGGQIILRSARLGKRVIPRLTNAHNYLNAQGIYRFLCLVQGQGVAEGLFWDWGPLSAAPFLPRVIHGRCVLTRARWHLSRDELRTLGKTHGTERWRAVQAWRQQRRLPRWLTLADTDHELPVDLDNVLSVETFIELVKHSESAILIELYPGPEDLIVQGPEGRFVHELVVPFLGTSRKGVGPLQASPERTPLLSGPPAIRRTFPPGSEWLFAKLYTSRTGVEQVLREVVGPVTRSALASGAADGWFFIRYGDPDWHLRLRIHGGPRRLQAEVAPALQAALGPWLEDGRVWRLQFDTYEREIERYGGTEGMGLAEKLFQIDSEAVLALLEAYPEDAREEVHWRLALCGIDWLLTDLGFDLAMKTVVLKGAREDFAREFRADAALKRQLGEKYRKESRTLQSLLDPGEGAGTPLTHGLHILRDRSKKWAFIMAALKQSEEAGRLTERLPGLARSFMHIHVNRLLRSAHRAQELILYDFLSRCYESRRARSEATTQRRAFSDSAS